MNFVTVFYLIQFVYYKITYRECTKKKMDQ